MRRILHDPGQVRSDRAQVANFCGRFVAWTGQPRIDPMRHFHFQSLAFLQRHFLVRLPVHLRHVRKTQAETLVIGSDQRIGALKVDVVLDDDQASLLELAIDSACRVGNQRGANSHARHHAHRKNHFALRVALIKMHAPLHGCNGDISHFADHHAPRVSDGRRARKVRDFFVVDARGVREFIGERTEAAAEHQADARTQLRLRQNKFCGAVGAQKILTWFCFCRPGCAHFRNIPTIEADIRFAIVPASIARMPNLASCDL